MGLMAESTTGTGYLCMTETVPQIEVRREAAGRLGSGALVLLAAALAGCVLPGGRDDGEPTQPTPTLADVWNHAILDMGKIPVLPPTEDMYVGDVYAFPGPPDYRRTKTSGWLTAATPRWKSLRVLADLDAEYRWRPAWNHTSEALRQMAPGEEGESLYRADRVPVRRRIVGLQAAANMTLDDLDLEPFLPAEVALLIEGPATPERFSVSVQIGEAESYSLSAQTVIEQLVEIVDRGDGPKTRLREEHLRGLPLAADPSTGRAYLAVVTEVLYIRSIEMTLRNRTASDSTSTLDAAGAIAATRRAEELNAALAQSGIEDRVGGSIEFGMVTDDSLTLRRHWPHALATAVRGVTLEVDAATGEVLRTAPLGIELPEFETAQDERREEEESEVLEELRRGKEIEALSPEELRETRLYWDHGPRFRGLKGDLTLALGGRLHLDAATFHEDQDINAAFGEPDSGVTTRRAFLELGGAFRRFDFNLWLDFSNGDFGDGDSQAVDYRNVFVGTWGIPVVGGVRVGYFKEPFGLEETTSSNDITFMERSLTDAFIERRNLGIMFQRRFTEQRRMTTALGFYRSADNDLQTGTGYGVSGRITGTPILAEDGRSVLHFGASATYRDPGSDGIRFQQTPESSQAQVLADTGTLAVHREFRVGAEIGAVLGSLSLQSETIVASSSGAAGVGDPTFWSTYLMGSYVLTGEHRSYRERVGAFGSVHPDRPFWQGGPGAIELALRYSYLDLDSAGIDGGKLHDWTLGLNWYANLNMRFMFNYIAAYPEGFDVQHALQARLQFTF